MAAHDDRLEKAAPVQIVDTGSRHDAPDIPKDGVALCLSGGGYRAMLFHVGALWRLNELGYLPRIARVSSVSGGSITAGVLGLRWSRLAWDASNVASTFVQEIVTPIRALARQTIDARAIIGGLLLPGSISGKVTSAYGKHLFGAATLQDLPDAPMFVFNATSLQTGALFRFSKPYAADYRVGFIPNPRFDLAGVVAASSAFPPVLSPHRLPIDPRLWAPPSGKKSEDLRSGPYLAEAVLTDGGVYDNLGLETAWKAYRTVLVSDGGEKMQPQAKPHGDWVRLSIRIVNEIDNQVRSLRKRQLIGSYTLAESDPLFRKGTYWGTRSDIMNYSVPGALPCPREQTTALAETPTRLARLDDLMQERLINWGYAICDAAMRRHVALDAGAPSNFPYPAAKVG